MMTKEKPLIRFSSKQHDAFLFVPSNSPAAVLARLSQEFGYAKRRVSIRTAHKAIRDKVEAADKLLEEALELALADLRAIRQQEAAVREVLSGSFEHKDIKITVKRLSKE